MAHYGYAFQLYAREIRLEFHSIDTIIGSLVLSMMMLAVIDWSGARVQPIEFSAVLPMFLCSLHPIFWEGGQFDNEERRRQEAKLAIQQARYVEVIHAEAQRHQVISVMAHNHSLCES